MLPPVSAAFEQRLRARDWERGEGKDRTVVFMKVRFQVLKAVFLKMQVFWVLCCVDRCGVIDGEKLGSTPFEPRAALTRLLKASATGGGGSTGPGEF